MQNFRQNGHISYASRHSQILSLERVLDGDDLWNWTTVKHPDFLEWLGIKSDEEEFHSLNYLLLLSESHLNHQLT